MHLWTRTKMKQQNEWPTINQVFWSILEDLKEKTRVQDTRWRSPGRSTEKIVRTKEKDRLCPVSRLDREQQVGPRSCRWPFEWRWPLALSHGQTALAHGWTARVCPRATRAQRPYWRVGLYMPPNRPRQVWRSWETIQWCWYTSLMLSTWWLV
jgi:hypothetical protein